MTWVGEQVNSKLDSDHINGGLEQALVEKFGEETAGMMCDRLGEAVDRAEGPILSLIHI